MGRAKQRTPQEQEIFDYTKVLTAKLKEIEPVVLQRASEILQESVGIQSLHGKIGGKFNTYTNVMRDQFADVRRFQDAWFAGLWEKYQTYQRYNTGASVWDIVQLVKDDVCLQYILLFIERNFYSHYEERVRLKPDEQLWELWFGDKLVHCLLIAPARLPNGSWRVDHSEIRRAPYQYWTIGHVFSVGGVIDVKSNGIIPITNLQELWNYYTYMIQATTKSPYETGICQRYLDYLSHSSNLLDEPFLIPELRYAGKASKHLYRLDFTILNPHTMEYIGFELSPSSTHMHLQGAGQTLTAYNAQIQQSWEHEMAKRNQYFQTFDITTVTFTDSQLQDLDKCFAEMANYLSRRIQQPQAFSATIEQLRRV